MSHESPWPNLFVVGAAKAGTTSLWRHLGAHPEIFMARVKEPHFFSGHATRLYPAIEDERAYLRLFAHARTPYRGEASPSYLWYEPAAARIKEVSPDARIVIALRDPVDRAYSMYWHNRRLGLERGTFAAAVTRQLDSRAAVPPYILRSRYADDLGRYLRLFGPQVHVVLFEEFVDDVQRELASLFAFLGVSPSAAGRIDPKPHNAFTRPRNRLAEHLLTSERARKTAQRLVPRSLRWPIERVLIETGEKPALDADTDARLTDFFRPDVLELARLLGRSLPWARWPDAMADTERARLAHVAG